MNKTVLALVSASTIMISAPSFSYESGDWIVRAGIASVQPDEESSYLALNGTNLQDLGLGLPPTKASVNSNEQLGLTITKMVSPSWGIELLAATPFTHEIDADALNVKAGETKHLPPTLSLQYYLNGGDSAFQPYIGLGLNYTEFFDEEVSDELNAALAGLGATGDADLSLDSSIGFAVEAGFDLAVNDNWVFNMAVWKIDLATTAKFDVPGLGIIRADVDIDPWAFMASAGYKF